MFAALGAPDGMESRILGEVYQVATLLREQETQVLILALSQIGCRSFHFSVFAFLSRKLYQIIISAVLLV